jgi:hypothetical protein
MHDKRETFDIVCDFSEEFLSVLCTCFLLVFFFAHELHTFLDVFLLLLNERNQFISENLYYSSYRMVLVFL